LFTQYPSEILRLEDEQLEKMDLSQQGDGNKPASADKDQE